MQNGWCGCGDRDKLTDGPPSLRDTGGGEGGIPDAENPRRRDRDKRPTGGTGGRIARVGGERDQTIVIHGERREKRRRRRGRKLTKSREKGKRPPARPRRGGRSTWYLPAARRGPTIASPRYPVRLGRSACGVGENEVVFHKVRYFRAYLRALDVSSVRVSSWLLLGPLESALDGGGDHLVSDADMQSLDRASDQRNVSLSHFLSPQFKPKINQGAATI